MTLQDKQIKKFVSDKPWNPYVVYFITVDGVVKKLTNEDGETSVKAGHIQAFWIDDSTPDYMTVILSASDQGMDYQLDRVFFFWQLVWILERCASAWGQLGLDSNTLRRFSQQARDMVELTISCLWAWLAAFRPMIQVIIISQRRHGCHSDLSSFTGLASSLAGGLEA